MPAEKTEKIANIIPVRERIQSLLEGLGQNAAWLSDKVGVARSTITRILNGDRHPLAETLQDIAVALGLTLEQLVLGTDAEDRVAQAKRYVARTDYEDAVRKVVEYERRANELEVRVR